MQLADDGQGLDTEERGSPPSHRSCGRARAALVGTASAVVLAVAGLSTSVLGSSTAYAARAHSAAALVSSATVVKTAHNSTFGTILVDGEGRTLYTFTNNGRPVSCAGSCASVWPPLTVHAGARVNAAGGLKSIGVVSGPNGTRIVAYKGLPLYRFAGDSSAGQANGNGQNTFGGIWRVVKVGSSGGIPSTAGGGQKTQGTAGSSSGGSYGY